MVIVDFANPDRATAHVTVDETEPGFDPVAIARRLREAIPHASRARLFRPGGSIDTDREGAPTPGEVLEDVVNRLLASRRVVRPANDDAAQAGSGCQRFHRGKGDPGTDTPELA